MRTLLLIIVVLSTGCAVTVQGPNGPERIYPVSGTMHVDTYNWCAPMVYVRTPHTQVWIPYGEHRDVYFPVKAGEDDQYQKTDFVSYDEHQVKLGSVMQPMASDYRSILTHKTLTVGKDVRPNSVDGHSSCPLS